MVPVKIIDIFMVYSLLQQPYIGDEGMSCTVL